MAVTSVFASVDARSGFALDLSRRIAQSQGLEVLPDEKTSTPEVLAAQEEKLGRLRELESALSATSAYMASAHGERAASAMAGIIYKSLGDGEINESSLGNAFLDVVRFVDSAFGTDAGDAFMDHLNGSLNETLNAFFDNGLNETFFAVSSGEVAAADSDALPLLTEAGTQLKDTVMAILENARKDADFGAQDYGAYSSGEREELLGVLRDITV